MYVLNLEIYTTRKRARSINQLLFHNADQWMKYYLLINRTPFSSYSFISYTWLQICEHKSFKRIPVYNILNNFNIHFTWIWSAPKGKQIKIIVSFLSCQLIPVWNKTGEPVLHRFLWGILPNQSFLCIINVPNKMKDSIKFTVLVLIAAVSFYACLRIT